MEEPSLPAHQPPSAPREPALDGLRGVAVLLVYLYHYGGGLHSEHIGGRFFGFLTEAGWTGVTIFFVLSGYLITGGLLASREQPHALRNFYARRALRILPLYFFCLALAFVFAMATSVRYDELYPLLVYAAFLQNVPRFVPLTLQSPPPIPLYHLWSLAVEEQFYLLWPLLLLIVRRHRPAFWLCVAVFAGSALFRVAVWSSAGRPEVKALWAGSLPVQAGALAAGAALAVFSRGPRWTVVARWAPLGLAAGAVLYGFASLRTASFDVKGPLQFTLGLPAVSLAAASLLVLAARPGPLRQALSFAPLRRLGVISYGVYMFHIVLQPLFDRLGQHFAHLEYGPRYQAVRFAAALPITIVVASLSYFFLESPFLDLKRFVPFADHLYRRNERA